MKIRRILSDFILLLSITAGLITLSTCYLHFYNPFSENTYSSVDTVTPAPTSSPTTTPPSFPAPNLAYWKFDQISGSFAPDSSGNGYQGTLMNEIGCLWGPGVSGNSLTLTGTNQGYVDLPDNIANTTDFTFTAWVYWNIEGDWQRIFDFGSDTSAFMLLTPRSGNNTIHFSIYISSLILSQQLHVKGQLSSGAWNHLAVSLNGDTGKLYINGSLKVFNTSMTINPQDLGAINNYLGKSQFITDPYFDGKLDEVMLYNYALTDAEIIDLYTGQGAPTPSPTPTPLLPDPVKYYKIINFHSGQTLGVSGSSTTPGGWIITWSDLGINDQQWQLIAMGGFYKILNRNSSLVVDVDSAAPLDDGTRLYQWTDSGTDSQLWTIEYVGSDHYRFINKNSGKALVTACNGLADGTEIIQFPYLGDVGQMWAIVELP